MNRSRRLPATFFLILENAEASRNRTAAWEKKCSMLGPAVSAQFKQLRSIRHQRPGRGKLRALFGMDAEALASAWRPLGEPRGAGGNWPKRCIVRGLRTWSHHDPSQGPAARAWRSWLAWWAGRRLSQAFVSRGWDGTLPGGGAARDAPSQTVETVWMPEGDGGEAGDGSDGYGRGSGAQADRCAAKAAGSAPPFAFRARWAVR